MVNIDYLIELLKISSPSNYEDNLINFLLKLKFDNFVPKLTPNGTLMFESKNKETQKETVLLDAHLDQVHYRVKKILNDGLIVAQSVGFESDAFIGIEVEIIPYNSTKNIFGVIVAYPPHLPIDGDTTNPNYSYIDTGLTTKKLKELIKPGDPIIFKLNPQKFGDDSIMGQGLDDKIGVYIMIELMNFYDKNIDKLKYHTIFNFSTREEIGNVSIDHVDDIPIHKMLIIDTDTAMDLSTMSEDELGTDIYIGQGPTLSRNHDDSPKIYKEMDEIAKKNNINIQTTYTNGFGVSNSYEYVKFINSLSQFVGIPIRNMHSPVETAKINDIENTYELIRLYLMK